MSASATALATSAPANPGDAHDFARANEAHFDEHAHKTDEEHPEARPIANLAAESMREAFPQYFDKERTELLDYACGVGYVSQALRPYVRNIVGVDISQKSVDIYNKQAEDLGFASDIRAVRAELKGEPGELDGAKFDLVVCSAAYHHFPSIQETTRALASLLKPGGALLVVDIKAAPDGKVLFPENLFPLVPYRQGFTEEVMRAAFEDAGLTEFEMKDGKTKPEGPKIDLAWFIARGVKAVSSGSA
ncbi:S-adenosyl-L-methionine-dependent methyltransferase [Trametes elegans]|nr:S-adenosyl-L-methionine-dependent methyltransferase [Trametes elegans]